MLHPLLSAASAYGPTLKQAPGIAAVASIVLIAIVCHLKEEAYIEFPNFEPMANVIALIERLQAESGVVFDLLDPDLWEPIDGGVRVHGMFLSSINGGEG